jgi:transposase
MAELGSTSVGVVMKTVTHVGVDLAKDVIVVAAADQAGRVVQLRQFSFRAFGEWVVNLPPCTIGMEACGSAHYWARRLASYGHTVRLIAGEIVHPFRKSRAAKNDRNDAQAILTAVRQPDMRYVTVKSVDQQAILAWHRMRQGWVEERTTMINRILGLLAEFGVWIPRSSEALLRALPRLSQDETLPERMRALVSLAADQLRSLGDYVTSCEQEIHAHAKQNVEARRVSELMGLGPITSSAIIATVQSVKDFRNGRQFAAWLGLVPRQSSSGGKQRLGTISKRGDTYVRGLLTQGARAALRIAVQRRLDKRTRLENWMVDLQRRAGYQKTLVAVANKNARMIWAVLAKGERYDPNAWQRFGSQTVPVHAN